VLVAKKGWFAPGGKEFVLEEGEYASFEKYLGLRSLIRFHRASINLGRELSSFWKPGVDYSTLSLKELLKKAEEEKKAGREKRYRALLVIFHSRVSLFLAPFFFVLVALPFSLLRKASVYTGFGFSFLFLFLYYFTMIFSFGLGVRGKLPVLVGGYAPSVLMLLLGGFSFWRWVRS
jgi:lipopolysaccharide export LptBFGC system permease protein LptF